MTTERDDAIDGELIDPPPSTAVVATEFRETRDSEIRDAAARGVPVTDLAADYGISPARVRHILRDDDEMAAAVEVEDAPAGQLFRGAIARVRLFDPDTLADVETDEMLAEGIPQSTRETYRREWARFIRWCGDPAMGAGHPREHLPATKETVRKYIKDHWAMTRTKEDGSVVLAGRRGRPYAYATVELALAVISVVHQWAGVSSPTRHRDVITQMRGYRRRWLKAGYRPDKAYALTPEDNLEMARSCDLTTVQGIRNAAMLRMHFELGARASELCNITFGDLNWQSPERLVVHISMAKGDKDRDSAVQADLDYAPEWCALLLLRQWIELAATYGITSGPVFRQVNPGKRRADGLISGSVRLDPIDRHAYEMVYVRAGARAGVDVDPVTRDKRKMTSHGARAGLITSAVDAGMQIAEIAPQTGHSLASPVIHEYYRAGSKFGDHNPGNRIRRARKSTDKGGDQ